MSARKRKSGETPSSTSGSSLEHTFEKIKDAIVSVKAHLNDPSPDARASLERELSHVSSLAMAMHDHRPRSGTNKLSPEWSDTLDREGVNLWNASTSVSRDEDGRSDLNLLAALRLAGYHLIAAGLEKHPSLDTLVHVLILASKTGSTLSEAGKAEAAATVLTSAAKFEELVRNKEVDQEGGRQEAKTRSLVVYYASRMEAAWRESNETMAWFMLEKLQDLDSLPPRDREQLCSKILEIGKAILRIASAPEAVSAGGQALEAVKWIQKAFALLEGVKGTDDGATVDTAELKRSVLRSLARAYFLSSQTEPENLTRAAATVDELLAQLDGIAHDESSKQAELQQLRWMRLAVSKREKAPDTTLLRDFSALVESMALEETDVTDILQELRTLTQYHHWVVTAVLQAILLRTLESEKGTPFVDKVLLTLLFHCAKDADHDRALKEVGDACDAIQRSDFDLPKVPTTACLTLLWQFGGRMYDAQKWTRAADWYLVGTHPIFKSMAASTSAKCFRKAALCYVNQKDYSRAATIVRRCPDGEATTCYVRFLAAAHQGLEEEATNAIQDMVRAADFDKRMLLLATQLAHESDMKGLLLSVLGALLTVVRSSLSTIDAEIEAVTVVRCIIRLLRDRLDYPGYDRDEVLDALLGHFATAKELLGNAMETKGAALVVKDIAWLWRVAYNIAVHACSEWENAELRVSAFFEVAKSLLEVFCEVALVEVDATTYLHMIYAGFASITARVFLLRARQNEIVGSDSNTFMGEISDAIASCLKLITSTLTRGQIQDEADIDRLHQFRNTLHIFNVDLCCRRGNWSAIPQIIENAGRCDAPAHNTFQAIGDILWDRKECPVDILFSALDAILHASLDRSVLSIAKFSRWLRAICTIALARNTSDDRVKAIGYVEQAVTVLKDQQDQNDLDDENVYPIDERQWLLATAYNTGIECLHASLLDEARRWFESSTAICRFVPDGDAKAEKISETYSHLLDRYSR